jgi:hypothetical protein
MADPAKPSTVTIRARKASPCPTSPVFSPIMRRTKPTARTTAEGNRANPVAGDDSAVVAG